MATTIHYPNESSTIDALWTILNQQSESVKKALAARLKESLSNEKVLPNKSMEEALAFVDTLSLRDKSAVPADENTLLVG